MYMDNMDIFFCFSWKNKINVGGGGGGGHRRIIIFIGLRIDEKVGNHCHRQRYVDIICRT